MRNAKTSSGANRRVQRSRVPRRSLEHALDHRCLARSRRFVAYRITRAISPAASCYHSGDGRDQGSEDGTTPSCCIKPRSSVTVQCSTILPSRKRKMSMPS
jgi:hypothetical protein